MDRAVILVSGGVNSAVAAAAARERYEPALLHVFWEHRTAEREKEAFERLASTLRIEQTLVAELPGNKLFGGNPRTSKRVAVEDAKTLARGIPATYVLGLMPSMLSLASAWAASLKAKRIIVGTSENHGTGGEPIATLYPDHRREFLQVFNLLLQYAKPPEQDLVVDAPLIDLTRAEVVRLGQQLKVSFANTWSCYSSNRQPCGRCLGCATRSTGFLQAGVPDPLLVETVTA